MFIDIIGTDLTTMKQYPKTVNFIQVGSFRVAEHEVPFQRKPLICLDLYMQGGWVEHIVCKSKEEAQALYDEYLEL